MNQCSYCGRKNEDDALYCGGCGKPLKKPAIKDEEADLKDPANTPVTVASLHSLQEAELLKSELEAVGIEAFIPEEYTTGVFSSITPFQQVTVRVPAKDTEAARNIVAAFAAASRVESQEDTPAGRKNAPPDPEPSQGTTVAYEPGQNPPGQTRCVSCGTHIPVDSILCPKCGWTQPRLA